MVVFAKNIILLPFNIIAVMIITLVTYTASFIVSADFLNKMLVRSFIIVRTVNIKILGAKMSYRGLENIVDGPVIFASKHQSVIETTFFFNTIKPKTLYCFKKELTKVPMWGRVTVGYGGIVLDRQHGASTYKNFINTATTYLEKGYSIAIFPEGTRVAVGQRAHFKKGVAKLYRASSVPVIPVALNTGLCIRKHSWLARPAHMVIEFLPPIHPGLEENEFMNLLETSINQKSDELAKETL